MDDKKAAAEDCGNGVEAMMDGVAAMDVADDNLKIKKTTAVATTKQTTATTSTALERATQHLHSGQGRQRRQGGGSGKSSLYLLHFEECFLEEKHPTILIHRNSTFKLLNSHKD